MIGCQRPVFGFRHSAFGIQNRHPGSIIPRNTQRTTRNQITEVGMRPSANSGEAKSESN